MKTRLAVDLGDELAVRIHEAMLLDWLDVWGSARVLAPGGRRVVVFDPPEAGPWFDATVPSSFALQAQVGGDLGAADEIVFRRGIRRRRGAGRAGRFGQSLA